MLIECVVFMRMREEAVPFVGPFVFGGRLASLEQEESILGNTYERLPFETLSVGENGRIGPTHNSRQYRLIEQ